jgi:hypothetical protein
MHEKSISFPLRHLFNSNEYMVAKFHALELISMPQRGYDEQTKRIIIGDH